MEEVKEKMIRPRFENTFSVCHNFHNQNYDYKKDEPQGYYLHDLGQNHYVAPSVKKAFVAYKAHLERIIKRLDYCINSNVPEVLQGIIGQPDDWYEYKEGPNGEKNNGKWTVTIDLPNKNGEPIENIIHPSNMWINNPK